MTNQDIIAQADQVIIKTYGRYPVAFVRGQGSTVWDADGKSYTGFSQRSGRLCARALPSTGGRGYHQAGADAVTRLELLPQLCPKQKWPPFSPNTPSRVKCFL